MKLEQLHSQVRCEAGAAHGNIFSTIVGIGAVHLAHGMGHLVNNGVRPVRKRLHSTSLARSPRPSTSAPGVSRLSIQCLLHSRGQFGSPWCFSCGRGALWLRHVLRKKGGPNWPKDTNFGHPLDPAHHAVATLPKRCATSWSNLRRCMDPCRG